jgi:hypothetical protein
MADRTSKANALKNVTSCAVAPRRAMCQTLRLSSVIPKRHELLSTAAAKASKTIRNPQSSADARHLTSKT